MQWSDLKSSNLTWGDLMKAKSIWGELKNLDKLDYIVKTYNDPQIPDDIKQEILEWYNRLVSSLEPSQTPALNTDGPMTSGTFSNFLRELVRGIVISSLSSLAVDNLKYGFQVLLPKLLEHFSDMF